MDNLDFALQVLVLGFLVVMVTLFALYAILVLFNRILYQPAIPAEAQAAGVSVPRKEEDHTAENRRVVAAVMAAIYQYMQTDQSFALKRPISIDIQPSGGTGLSNWQIIGRRELLESSLELENIRRKKRRENIQGNR